MNFTQLIKNDNVLSAYDFATVYQVLLRLKHLGLLCKCRSKRGEEDVW